MSINVICTDRGQHVRTMVRWARIATDLPDEGDSFTFRCRRCRRAPRISLSAWPRLVERYEAEGRAELDISYLP